MRLYPEAQDITEKLVTFMSSNRDHMAWFFVFCLCISEMAIFLH